MGYHRAGFEVTGVDIRPQKNYPFPFVQADVYALDPDYLRQFDLVHASPPCQAYTSIANINRSMGVATQQPGSIERTRALLQKAETPYVIENVKGAPLHDPLVLCGCMFLGTRVLRQRLFESTFSLEPPQPCQKPHPKSAYTTTRNGMKIDVIIEPWLGYMRTGPFLDGVVKDAFIDAMGVPWMKTWPEVTEAIPPAYTYYIGREILKGRKSKIENRKSDGLTAGNRNVETRTA